MTNDIYKKYNIDKSKLKRDYILNPLIWNEIPDINDIKYLWIDKNMSKKDICKYFNRSETYFTKFFKKNNIKKKQEFIKIIRNSTNIKNFGVINPFQNKKIKEKIIDTLNKKYGVSHISKSEYFKKQYIKTSLERYGVSNYAKTKECKEKEYITMIKNGTNGKSREENRIYNLLISKYENVIRQYKSNLYPFRCDFYIPKLDLYIEYQGFWTHGDEPYIGTKEQKEKIKIWESKNTPQYKKAINDWTKVDILKRTTAKENNLNYLEFFNINEFMEWYNKTNI